MGIAASAATTPVCEVNANSGAFGGTQGVVVNGVCRPTSSGPSGSPTKTIFCQRTWSTARGWWNPQCGKPVSCLTTLPGHGIRVADAYATLTLVNGTWRNPVVWCPSTTRPGIDQSAIREQAIRLLPPVAIGSAWSHTALVNAEVILWAATPTNRALPAITLSGQHISLRIQLRTAHWSYGDGSQQTRSTPDRPYDRQDPCHTAQCPHYAGHTYTSTGLKTITLTITWHAQYRTGTGTWQDIDRDITGPTTRHQMTVKQARAVLVPNP
jgi:hypothetical protein